MQNLDVAIVGGGAIGLSIGRSLSKLGKSCIVLEKASYIGSETSSRSSEVLHAGIYNNKNLLKTKFCLEGKVKLLEYIKSRNISHNICGKLIVSSSVNENEALMKLFHTAKDNGLNDLHILNHNEAYKMEPEVKCELALFSPNTGIFDTHDVLQHFENDILSCGSDVITDCEFLLATQQYDSRGEVCYDVMTNRGNFNAKVIINAAGLFAPLVSHRIPSFSPEKIPIIHYVKGNYFKLANLSLEAMPFHHLIYPMPGQGGLGIHATLNLQGAVRFGPDTEWLPQTSSDWLPTTSSSMPTTTSCWDYALNDDNQALKNKFLTAIASYWPNIQNHNLVADYCGIRPKAQLISSNGGNAGIGVDFVVHTERDHGARNIIALYGMESPGWTSSIAIGDCVAELVKSL